MHKDSKFRLIDYSEATQHFYDLGPNTLWNLTIEGLNWQWAFVYNIPTLEITSQQDISPLIIWQCFKMFKDYLPAGPPLPKLPAYPPPHPASQPSPAKSWVRWNSNTGLFYIDDFRTHLGGVPFLFSTSLGHGHQLGNHLKCQMM